jgi:hypothetical protein
MDRRLGGPQTQSGHSVKEKNSQPPSGIEPYHPIIQPAAMGIKVMKQMIAFTRNYSMYVNNSQSTT